MRYIFENLKQYWRSVLLLAVLLVVQGFCEMSMPQYTQNIIDVGIQNKGLEHITPSSITAGEFEAAQIFMDDAQKREWTDAYEKDGSHYSLQSLSGEKLKELDEDLLMPLVMAYQLGHMPEESFRTMMKTQAENALQSQKLKGALLDAAKKQADRLNSMSAKEIAEAYGLDITTFEAEDEKGNISTYVDVRPAIQKMIDSGQMSEDSLSQMKKQITDTISQTGSQTMRAMAIRYAA